MSIINQTGPAFSRAGFKNGGSVIVMKGRITRKEVEIILERMDQKETDFLDVEIDEYSDTRHLCFYFRCSDGSYEL